jgi:hypothetical protein
VRVRTSTTARDPPVVRWRRPLQREHQVASLSTAYPLIFASRSPTSFRTAS